MLCGKYTSHVSIHNVHMLFPLLSADCCALLISESMWQCGIIQLLTNEALDMM